MKVISILSLFGVLLASPSIAQHGPRWRGSGGWGPGGPYVKLYDPKTVETLRGEVVSVDLVMPMKGMSQGVHLAVKTDKETIPVHLGPSWYLENQDVKFAPKDMVEVKGSRVMLAGKPALIAAEVQKGDATLTLRDDNGFPAWSAMRRR
ncbi:MAG TPA: hypothetical protein VLA62_12595 [Solirubrobacterales bacterium]|nr:hypothetical protein [Solirubrobacterales bacterium]